MEQLKKINSIIIILLFVTNLPAQSKNIYFIGETIDLNNPVIIADSHKMGNIILEEKNFDKHFENMLNYINSYLYISDIYFLDELDENILKELKDSNYRSCNQYNLENNKNLEIRTIKENVKEFLVGFIEVNYYNANIITADNSKTILKKTNGKTYYKFVIANCAK